MKIKYGLISCDSHAQLHKDTWTSRMSKAKFGDKIPQLRETTDKEHMIRASDKPVERWFVNGKVVGERGTVNCPTVMGDPMRKTFPQRWDEVPPIVYDPVERLKALDDDGVDGEVLFPNDPVQSGTFFQGDAEFELALRAGLQRRARRVARGERSLRAARDHSVPERHRSGGEGNAARREEGPSRHRDARRAEHDAYGTQALQRHVVGSAVGDVPGSRRADPLACGRRHRDLRCRAGRVSRPTRDRRWARRAGSPPRRSSSPISSSRACSIASRSLRWVCAETGIGWVNYMLEMCDHEWERRHLWTRGHRDAAERALQAPDLRRTSGTSAPASSCATRSAWTTSCGNRISRIRRPPIPSRGSSSIACLKGVPQAERDQLCYGNALRTLRPQLGDRATWSSNTDSSAPTITSRSTRRSGRSACRRRSGAIASRTSSAGRRHRALGRRREAGRSARRRARRRARCPIARASRSAGRTCPASRTSRASA